MTRPRISTDVDPIAVDRLVSGDPPAVTTTAERTHAVRELSRLGMSSASSARRMRCSARTIQRYRRRAGVYYASRLHRELARAWQLAQQRCRGVRTEPTAEEIEQWKATARWLREIADRSKDAA